MERHKGWQWRLATCVLWLPLGWFGMIAYMLAILIRSGPKEAGYVWRKMP